MKLTSKEQKIVLLLAVLLLLGVVLRFVLPPGGDSPLQRGTEENYAVEMNGEKSDPAAAATMQAASNCNDSSDEMIIIHMAGAVVHPGVYHLPQGARIYQLLEEAGGALDDADLEGINLAQPLVDGQQVFLPRKGDDHYEQPVPAGMTTGNRVNINTATQNQLETLPGIGTVKAQSIINYRQQNGPFQSIENLLEVSGIGEKTLEGLREYITVW